MGQARFWTDMAADLSASPRAALRKGGLDARANGRQELSGAREAGDESGAVAPL